MFCIFYLPDTWIAFESFDKSKDILPIICELNENKCLKIKNYAHLWDWREKMEERKWKRAKRKSLHINQFKWHFVSHAIRYICIRYTAYSVQVLFLGEKNPKKKSYVESMRFIRFHWNIIMWAMCCINVHSFTVSTPRKIYMKSLFAVVQRKKTIQLHFFLRI